MSDNDGKKRKYLLYSQIDGRSDSEKPCAFFASSQGCRNGKTCRFLHTDDSSKRVPSTTQNPIITNSAATIVNVKSDSVTAEILHETDIQQTLATQQRKFEEILKQQQEAYEAKMREQLHALGKQSITSTPLVTENYDKARRQGVVISSATKGSTSSNEEINPVKEKKENKRAKLWKEKHAAKKLLKKENRMKATVADGRKSQSYEGTDSFHSSQGVPTHSNANEAVGCVSNATLSSFKMPFALSPLTTVPLTASTNPIRSDSLEPLDISKQAPLPVIKILTWSSLVDFCKEHNRYDKDYVFHIDSTWTRAEEAGDWCAGLALPSVIGIDCEMCETEDPLTSEKDSISLIRMSIVNGGDVSEVVADTLVLPVWPVTDMRTRIHGIAIEQLRNVTFSLRHAQAVLRKLCTKDTIIVGHAVHNDLKALRFEHYNIVDTSYLFSLEGERVASPSLRDVSSAVLGTVLSDIHDSVEDAQSALKAASHVINNGWSAPIPRIVKAKLSTENTPAPDPATSLLVHRIPADYTEERLGQVLVAETNIVPQKISPIFRGIAPTTSFSSSVPATGSLGKATVTFANKALTDMAFDLISGGIKPDKSNKAQKRIHLNGGGYICVRKY